MDILQYESKIWATANILRGCGIKESEWPSFMMPFFALAMVESRLIRMLEEEKKEIGEEALLSIDKEDLYEMIKDKGQVRIKFQALPENIAGAVYYIRLARKKNAE